MFSMSQDSLLDRALFTIYLVHSFFIRNNNESLNYAKPSTPLLMLFEKVTLIVTKSL